MADPELTFTVLGTVRAFRAGRELPLGPAKPRTVLAMLLLAGGRPVARAEIIDGVWGEDPPESAANLVATYVARLRRALEPDRARRAAGQVITSTATGYALRAGPGAVDVDRFERLVARAGGNPPQHPGANPPPQHPGGNPPPQRRRAYLDEALALWTGEPLAGLSGPYVAAARARLVERRIGVLTERIRLGLDAGEQAEWIAELTGLVARYPYREELRGLLMLALYRAGRRGEALAAFADTRRVLAEHLGVEPGAALRRLHHRMLTADPGLAEAAGADAAGPPVPAQLPAVVGDFTGRHAEARTVEGWLDRAMATFGVVTGPAGVGKSTLAVRAAHRCRAGFPDGQLYADLHGAGPRPADPADVLARFLRDLGVAAHQVPSDVDGRVALFRTVLAGRRVLILLDDAADAAQVQPLLPGGPGNAVLVTSRNRLVQLPGAGRLELDTLGPVDAYALLARIAGADRVAAEPAAAARVLAACAGLPLALRIAGVRLANRSGWTVGTLADRLGRTGRRLAELRAGGLAVQGSFEVSYAALDPLAARTFRLLATLDIEEVPVAVAATVLDRPVADAEGVLEQLVDVHLVASPEPGRYRYHQLLHLFARQCAARDERDAALHRALCWYLAAVREADRYLRPGRLVAGGWDERPRALPRFPDADAALAWLEQERPSLIGIGLQAAACPEISPLLPATLLGDLRAFLHRRGHWRDLGELAEAVVEAARREGHRHAEALARLERGAGEYLRRRLDPAEADLRQAVALLRELDDTVGLSRALNNLSLVCTERGDHVEAAELVAEDLVLARRLGDLAGQTVALDNLALVEVRRGGHRSAVRHCAESVALHRRIGSPLLASAAVNILGLAYAGMGRYPAAIRSQRLSVRLARRGGNRYRQAQALSDLAAAYHAAGRPYRAVSAARQAAMISARLG